jgi:hypothetical protein
MDDLRKSIGDVQDRLRQLRADRTRLRKVFETAKAAVAEHESEQTIRSAAQAKEALQSVEQAIDDAQLHENQLLRTLGDREHGVAGWTRVGGSDGWADAARKLVGGEQTKAELSGSSVLMAAVNFTAPTTVAQSRVSVTSDPPRDTRFVYPVLRQVAAGDGELAVGGFTIRYDSAGISGLTGIERDPLATTQKEELGAQIDWSSEDLSQFAIVLKDVPQKVLDVEPSLRSLLQTEMQYRLNLAIDAHVVAAFAAANPPSGSSGSDLIAQVRNAIAAAQALGSNPQTLLLSPEDAATLDLTQVGADDLYLFATRAVGGADPLWGLSIRTSEAIDDPILVSPDIVGALHVGGATVLVDPYSGMSRNVVSIRLELEALAFVENPNGLYVIT